MRHDAATIKKVKPGDILQVDPSAQLGFEAAGHLAIVVDKDSSGVQVSIPSLSKEGTRRLTWANVEPTGGSIVWGADGERFKAQEEMRHHP